MLDRFAELSTLLGVNVVGYDYVRGASTPSGGAGCPLLPQTDGSGVVLLCGQTGYGASSGSVPSEEDCYADIEAVFDWLTSYRAPHTQVATTITGTHPISCCPHVLSLDGSGLPLSCACLPGL